MDRKKFLILGVLAAAALLVIGVMVWQLVTGKTLFEEPWTGVEGTPVDVALNFVEPWLDARKIGPDEPFNQGLLEYTQVGKELKAKLQESQGKLGEEGAVDPVLCQAVVPESLRTMRVYEKEDAAQILIMSTARDGSGQAVITMAAKNGLWQLTDITCGSAENGPRGEFSFEKSGFLLKQVPAPLDSNYWHLVFQEEGVLGHAVPLFINESSICVKLDGTEVACDDNILKETIPARVKGEMSETGVTVKRIELIDSVSID